MDIRDGKNFSRVLYYESFWQRLLKHVQLSALCPVRSTFAETERRIQTDQAVTCQTSEQRYILPLMRSVFAETESSDLLVG